MEQEEKAAFGQCSSRRPKIGREDMDLFKFLWWELAQHILRPGISILECVIIAGAEGCFVLCDQQLGRDVVFQSCLMLVAY